MMASPLIAAVVVLLVSTRPPGRAVVGARRSSLLWAIAPGVAYWLSIPVGPRERAAHGPRTPAACEGSRARRGATTRRSSPRPTSWLPPDNYQEGAEPRLAQRTSPTNIGMTLLSTLAAHDLGYLTTAALIRRIDGTLTTLEGLERHEGHLLNWYDTATLAPLHPRYVSTVDSGNLAAALIALAQGLADARRDSRRRRTQLLDGLLDTADLLALTSSSSSCGGVVESRRGQPASTGLLATSFRTTSARARRRDRPPPLEPLAERARRPWRSRFRRSHPSRTDGGHRFWVTRRR